MAADYDLAKLLGSLHTPFDSSGVLEVLLASGGVLPDRANRGLHVLVFQCSRDSGRCHAKLSHLVRLQPNPHRIIGTELLNRSDAFDTFQLFHEINTAVVFHKAAIVRAIRRPERKDHRAVRSGFFRNNAGRCDFRRQLGIRLGYAVLRLHRCQVGILAQFELYIQRIYTIVGACRIHRDHAFGAIDLQLDDLGDALFDNFSVRTVIVRRDIDCRRGNLGILGNRQIEPGDQSAQYYKN